MTWGRRRREMRLERKSATKRHLIQDGRSGSHATLPTELSHYRMSKIISSVHPGMIDKADSEGPWPIANLYLGHVITTNQSDVSLTVQSPNRSTRGSFLLLLSELWRCHCVFLQQTHHAFVSDSATTTSIFQFIRNIIFHLFLFSPG